MGAMLGNNEEAADDREQHEALLHSSSDDVSLRFRFIAHEHLLWAPNSCRRTNLLLVSPTKTAGQTCTTNETCAATVNHSGVELYAPLWALPKAGLRAQRHYHCALIAM